ncbi:hypothetical protein CANINC_002399 [Pichia inconspicua]|uniref:Reverse transcriptase Ty1/copia-type domain-containing protein n=1 Tax=Pichia inconspicua TaxID=52247 RepID=A0A4T0X2J9_9ASCO|nr:hypothetical protein CANINC_002399 [[Candida] inconspicua]
MIVSSKYICVLEELSRELMKSYRLKKIEPDDTGMQRFLGMNLHIIKNKNQRTELIKVNQKEYIEQITSKEEVSNLARIQSPLPPGYYFDLDRNKNYFDHVKDIKKLKTSFKEEIGQLLYIAVMTRPDIAYSVNYLAQFCETPHPETFDMIRRIRLFLYKTSDKSLEFQKVQGSRSVNLYTDSDYARGTVYWKSKYTSLVCTSSAQAELQAIFFSLNESIWFRQLIIYLGMAKKSKIVTLYVDNMSIINSINNDGFSQLSKHYAVRLAAVKERINLMMKIPLVNLD